MVLGTDKSTYRREVIVITPEDPSRAEERIRPRGPVS